MIYGDDDGVFLDGFGRMAHEEKEGGNDDDGYGHVSIDRATLQ